MKKTSLALLASVLALLAIACAEQQSNQPTANTPAAATPAASVDEFAAARANYAKMCTDCHGKTGGGGTVQIDGKRLKVPSLREGTFSLLPSICTVPPPPVLP